MAKARQQPGDAGERAVQPKTEAETTEVDRRQAGEALKASLKAPIQEVISLLRTQIEPHYHREGLAIALDQWLGSLNKIVERISSSA